MLRLPDEVEDYLKENKQYDAWAYAFMYNSLSHAAKIFGMRRDKENHITAAQLSEAICSLAIKEFGFLAQTVMKQWRVKTTEDIGEIVYILVQCKMMRQSEKDKKADFIGVFDLMDRLDPDKIEEDFKFLDKC